MTRRLWWLWAWLADIWDALPVWWAWWTFRVVGSVAFVAALVSPSPEWWVRVIAAFFLGSHVASSMLGEATERLSR